jgi:hypothetical protein
VAPVIDTNVNGPFIMARHAVPVMLKAGWGRIVNVSVSQGTMRRCGFSPYSPSKAALESETIIWAQDLEGTGVTVNALLPGGATLTGMVPQTVSEKAKSALLDPSIMVPPLLWLVSPEADGMTGQFFQQKGQQRLGGPQNQTHHSRQISALSRRCNVSRGEYPDGIWLECCACLLDLRPKLLSSIVSDVLATSNQLLHNRQSRVDVSRGGHFDENDLAHRDAFFGSTCFWLNGSPEVWHQAILHLMCVFRVSRQIVLQ